MNNKYIKWLTGGLLGIMAVFSLGSCSDDHYDLNTTNATGTLYDNIVATQQCDSFLMILDKALVNKKSYGTPAALTYGELLKGTKSLTVWAPKDGTYYAKKWLNLLDEAKQLDEAGDRVGAADLYKTVEKQFAQNHLSYFNYNGSYPEVKRITFANGKYAVYDAIENTIKNVNIPAGSTQNVASVNGTLHVLEASIPYAYDLREIIDVTPELSAMHDYIAQNDTLMFKEEYSTEGSVVDGKMQYVDSVFWERNKVMPAIASQADSVAAAIYFTNDAWNQGIEHVKSFFKYKPAYSYVDERGNVYTDSLRADSLQEAKAVEAIFKNMYYSLYEQKAFLERQEVEEATVESVKDFFETADSLVSTEYYISESLYHPKAPYCNELTDHQTPIEASNGFAFLVDNFNFKANKAWQYDKTYEVEGGWIVNTQYSKSLSTASPTGVRHYVSDGNRNPAYEGMKISEDAYQEFVPSSSAANPQVAFNLSDVLSGTYDIYVVIVPENMVDPANTSPKANKFNAMLTYDYDDKGAGLTVNATGPENGSFISDVTKVDTILLFEDYKFDACFYKISNSRPMLTITSALKLSDRKTCTPNLNIDCILLVAKDE
ncbi:MAG: hypothetical protein J5678_03920 [Bacteroidaceae bacterium]|nr:hypothetical protein [Bacteroidaceae bacterium]